MVIIHYIGSLENVRPLPHGNRIPHLHYITHVPTAKSQLKAQREMIAYPSSDSYKKLVCSDVNPCLEKVLHPRDQKQVQNTKRNELQKRLLSKDDIIGVQITDAKDLPNKLCSKCVQNTEQCYIHRETYKRHERVLYDMIEEAKNSPSSKYVYSPADSNHSSSLGVSSDPCYIKSNSSANNINNSSNSPGPNETNESLASHVEVLQECDEMAAEATKAHNPEETVSEYNTICTDNNAKYGTYNEDKNVIVDKTEPDNDYDEEYTSKDHRKHSCPTRALEVSGFRTQDAGDDNNSSDEGNVTNRTPKNIRANSPAVIVKPAYEWSNLQGSRQSLIFQTKNPDDTDSEVRPQVMQVGEWANNQGQSNAPTDPSDRMGVLLFAAAHIKELNTRSDDGQSPGTPKVTTAVHGKFVSSEQKRKICQTQSKIRRHSDGHQVQQQINDINASLNIPRKRTTGELSVQKMCSNCRTTCSSIWRRINENPVCNACGLYYKLHGKIRPLSLKRDFINTRQRRKRSDNGMNVSMDKKQIKIKKTKDTKLGEDCYKVEQPLSPNSAAVKTIIEDPVQDETLLNVVSK
ncbi:uncharacterized protein LOC115033250 [Acyrthosiphon pisum]|uniref:GATA-type domain-containing protein n=1 Tax=Acyrthosiphon pisum TaxID=7029 RepID=A0A8R2JLL9_ACYPI|nr:uncharacterized protein LOC115033250 [Acyrthosiphon pisum]